MKNFLFAAFVFFALPMAAMADEVILDDHIVQGSQCVGQDCNEGEVFGFSSLILKENNLRIFFNDTSASAQFPSTDWQITINDSSNGGAHYFAIEDRTEGVVPFRINRQAPDNSLLVDSSGYLGVGTGAPAHDLHIIDGNAPTIRLEQDGTGGFTPRTWDLTANEDTLTISADGNAVWSVDINGNVTNSGIVTAGNPPKSYPMADYVFADNYQLMPLGEVQDYISANSHLPGVPSAAEVAENGLNMTQMQMSLLQKVEELHLYTLQQQALIDDLQEQVRELSANQ